MTEREIKVGDRYLIEVEVRKVPVAGTLIGVATEGDRAISLEGAALSALNITWEQAAGLVSGASVVVPKEPTEAMTDAGVEAADKNAYDPHGFSMGKSWAAMLAADPKPGDE